jgi:nucleotide-binding universal stress UspA family protein
MCAIDFSDFTSYILSYGKSLATEFGSTLYLCHIVSGAVMISSLGHSYFTYTELESDRIRYATDRLEELIEELDIECKIIVSSGHAADEINETARENNIDMVIAATHGGSGIKRFLIGSVTDRLIKILTCPLLVLHARENHLVSPVEERIKLTRILVGCDFSPDSRLAFDYALSLAQEFQTQLYLAHVIRSAEHTGLTISDHIKIQGNDHTGWTRSEYLDLQENAANEDVKEKNALSNRIEKQLSSMVPEESRNWCTPITIQLEGQPYKELINFAEQEQVDMIVLGVHGYSLLEQFLVGSTTDRVISQASCSVLVVRQTA